MFFRVRTIKGRQYLYAERRWRDGRKVRSESRSLGPLDGAIAFGKATQLGHGGYLEQMAQYPSPVASPQTPATPSPQSPDDAPATEPSSEPSPPSDQE